MTDQCFFPGSPVSSTNKADHHNITEILLKVALNTIKQTNILWWNFDSSILDIVLIYIYVFVITGIILEYEQGGNLKTKSIDLLDLKPEYVSIIHNLKLINNVLIF